MSTIPKSTGPSGPSTPPPSGATQGTTTVKSGENVSDVAKREGVDEQLLKNANPHVKDFSKITAGQELKLPEKKTSEKPASDSSTPTKASDKDARARTAERSMEGTIMEANLRNKAEAPPDADTLIKKHSGMLGSLDEDALGKEMAGMANKDFAASKKSIDGVMNKLSDSDRDDVALAFTQNMSDDQLKKMASSPDGQSTLHRMEKELLDGSVGSDERGQANRIHDALKDAKLDPKSNSEVLINRYTKGPNLDEDGLGKELAGMAKKDPTEGAKQTDAVLDKLGSGDRDDVSVAMSKNLSDEDMKKMAATKEGAQTLSRMEKEILDGNVSSDERSEANRIHNSLDSAKLDPNDRAGTLIDRHTYGLDLKEDALGKELADMAKKDPAAGAKQADAVLNKLGSGDRDDVSEAMTKNMSHADLKKLAGTPEGKALMDRMHGEMKSGWTTEGEHTQMARLESAKTAVNLEADPKFQALSENTRKDVLSAMERGENNSDVTKNIAELSTTPGFEKLSETSRKDLIDAMEKKGAGTHVSGALKSLAGNAEFQGLSDAARSDVVRNLTKFSETESYKKMSEVDKGKAINIMSTLSLESAGHPTATSLKNTVNHLCNGTVKMELYEEKDSTTFGTASDGTMRFNVGHPRLLTDRNELVATAAHEVNHVLNGNTSAGTKDRFLDEYRAWYMERTALGENPPSVAHMKGVVQNLATNAPGDSSYAHLRKIYRDDPDFKRVVDQMVTDLNATPPKVTTPEDLRAKLAALPGGDKSDYLKKTGNDDNH
jgi:LysM domain